MINREQLALSSLATLRMLRSQAGVVAPWSALADYLVDRFDDMTKEEYTAFVEGKRRFVRLDCSCTCHCYHCN